MKYYIHVLKNYATFSGRARRSEYWYFVLFNIFALIIAMILDNALGTTLAIADEPGPSRMMLPYGWIYILYSVFTILPGLAVAVRRLHDTDRSGAYILLVFIPIIGSIWLLVLMCLDSTSGPNKYGPNPKGFGNTDEIDQIGSYLPA